MLPLRKVGRRLSCENKRRGPSGKGTSQTFAVYQMARKSRKNQEAPAKSEGCSNSEKPTEDASGQRRKPPTLVRPHFDLEDVLSKRKTVVLCWPSGLTGTAKRPWLVVERAYTRRCHFIQLEAQTQGVQSSRWPRRPKCLPPSLAAAYQGCS